MKHVVALSGGKDSTAMALRLAEVEPREYSYICTPTGDELPELLAHWAQLEDILGAPIIKITNRTLDAWIEEFQSLPNWRMRWCTRLLKVEPMMAYLLAQQPVTHYVGLRADEETRVGIYGEVAALTRHPLREWGWGVQDVWDYLKSRNITIPRRTDCARCFFQRLPEWRTLWRKYPAVYAEAEEQEMKIGATFRSPSRDKWPASLKELRAEFERGRKIRGVKDDDDEAGTQCRACSL